MTRPWTAGLVLVVLALLTGCSNGAPDPSAGNPSSSAEAAASPSAAAESPVAPPPTGGTPAERVCAYLDQVRAQMDRATSVENARTVLTVQLAALASQNPDLERVVSTQLDALTTQGCPQTRQAILTRLGVDSFSAALR
ncbi:hypothetical protein [Cryptosporangium minutisporangium]|uniref:Lipoprotein n=1 Tax=Cryptosporangium minutisporangium TaxID=113569 RepID=A0ABP6SXQ0_9ACTN